MVRAEPNRLSGVQVERARPRNEVAAGGQGYLARLGPPADPDGCDRQDDHLPAVARATRWVRAAAGLLVRPGSAWLRCDDLLRYIENAPAVCCTSAPANAPGALPKLYGRAPDLGRGGGIRIYGLFVPNWVRLPLRPVMTSQLLVEHWHPLVWRGVNGWSVQNQLQIPPRPAATGAGGNEPYWLAAP